MHRVLVIKLGALGDFVQATGPFAAIRRHHRDAEITLLTTRAYADLGRELGFFDRVWVDVKPRALQPGAWLELRSKLRQGGFDRVYDLQTSGRSSFYFKLFWPGPWPEWSGIAKGCSHPHANPDRDFMHTIERQAEQLRMAGIEEVPPPDLSGVAADISGFGLVRPFALLVPGGAPHRPAKRWPAGHYGRLAGELASRGIQPVVLGTQAEAEVAAQMTSACPAARELIGRTSFADIIGLARAAEFAVGNDTGPMHLIAVAGCRSYVLYSQASDPALCGQRGRDVTILRRENLADLGVGEVVGTLAL